MVANPFRPTRYEHHNKPLLWLSPRALVLEGEGSFYVSGTRGSGKTSLLKTLDWRERHFNEPLRSQLRGRKSPFLSVYFRLPDHISCGLASTPWSKVARDAPNPDAIGFSYFAALIESIACQLVYEALDEHRLLGELPLAAAEVRDTIGRVCATFPELKAYGGANASTFSELAGVFNRLHRTLNVAATRGGVAAALNSIPVYEPGGLIETAAQIASRYFREHQQYEKFQIKVCVDDCEVLRKKQQQFLNGLVRKAKAPISWIISYVGKDYEATTGVYKDHNLSQADRKLIDLDAEAEADFIRLCEAVSSLRIYYSMSEAERAEIKDVEIEKIFSSDRVLGNYDVNDLIESATRSALSSEFETLRERAVSLRDSMRRAGGDPRRRARVDELFPDAGAPPYYQTFVMYHQLYPQKDLEKILREMSKAELSRLNAYLRRKQRAAFIAFCARYRIKNVPYAGKNVVYGLSDGCIRDFLEIMAEIFDAYSTPKNKLLRFAVRRSPLVIETQRQGIAATADAKFDGIRENIETNPVELSRLVECLGHLTALLHRDIGTAERGLYLFEYDGVREFRDHDASEVRKVLMRVIGRGVSEGLLRTESSRTEGVDKSVPRLASAEFRLHRRFGPRFGFSFRGPYEPARIPSERVAEICFIPESVEPREWARSVFDAISKTDSAQGRLDL